MEDISFQEAAQALAAKDPRYPVEAYHLLREGLDFTVKALRKEGEGPRHVSGKELLDGLRDYVLNEFGPLSLTVLNAWGIRRTADFGELVFNLVEAGKLSRTEQDSRADFADGYDFHEAFAKPFEVTAPVKRVPARRRSRR